MRELSERSRHLMPMRPDPRCHLCWPPRNGIPTRRVCGVCFADPAREHELSAMAANLRMRMFSGLKDTPEMVRDMELDDRERSGRSAAS